MDLFYLELWVEMIVGNVERLSVDFFMIFCLNFLELYVQLVIVWICLVQLYVVL